MTTTPPTRRVRRCRVSETTDGPRLMQSTLERSPVSRSRTNPSLADVAQVAALLAERSLLMRGL